MIALRTVPIPGVCLRGIHRTRITMLTIKVAIPIEISRFSANP